MERRPSHRTDRTASRLRLARIRIARALLAGGLLLPAAPANAQRPDATESFDYGLAEMLAGRYATGCPALESSFRLDPRPGTLFTLADCDRKWGKTASALARFDEYVALYERMPPDQKVKQRDRAAVAASERASLERSVPLLAVRLPGDAPAGTRVWRDDTELTGTALAAAVPVDPGDHSIRVQLPDGRSKEQAVSLQGGEQRTLVADIGPLGADATTAPTSLPAPVPRAALRAAPPAAPAESAQAPPPQAPPPALDSSPRPGQAAWVYASAGLGAASLVVAGVTGGIALSQRSIASPVCDARGLCTTEQGVNAGNLARTMADVETGALIAGGVALGAALVLWLTERRADAKAHAASVRRVLGGIAAEW